MSFRPATNIRLLVPAAVVGLTALMLASPGASAASTARASGPLPRACSSISDPYSTPKSVLRRCGYQLIPLQSVQALPGGGKAYVYQVDGTREEEIVPPRGFDALTASDSQLTEYGIPTAGQVGSRGKWIKIMGAARYTTPPSTLIAGGPAGLTDSLGINSPAGPGTSYNWAGYIATDNSNFDEVQASYDEPYIGSSKAACSDLQEGTWVGIGGNTRDNGNFPYLAQVGTAFGNPAQPNLHNEFQELVISQTQYAPVWGGKVTYGDPIYAQMSWNSSNDNFTYYVTDSSNGNTMDVTNYSAHYNGESAEIITEAPLGSDLANFGTITFTDSKVGITGSSPSSLGSWDPTATNLIDAGGNTMAYPNPIYGSGKDFTNNDRSCS